jgi:hypothetical protein
VTCAAAVDRLAEADAPIAMNLTNAAMRCPFDQHWHGTLYLHSTTWFRCDHEHPTLDYADACARRRWFQHHG